MKDEGKKHEGEKRESRRLAFERVRERVQHVFSLSRSFQTAECSRSNAGMKLVFYRIVECPNDRERGKKETLIYFVLQ